MLLVGLVLVLVAIGIVFMVGMRTKSPPVLHAVRRFNRAFTNPRAMKKAGTPGAYASVIRHVGRTTGRPYETPVEAFATDDGFLIALPYGSDADWLKNVLARHRQSRRLASHQRRASIGVRRMHDARDDHAGRG